MNKLKNVLLILLAIGMILIFNFVDTGVGEEPKAFINLISVIIILYNGIILYNRYDRIKGQ